jgi:hypothetical protein
MAVVRGSAWPISCEMTVRGTPRRGALLVDQVINAGTFVGHGWGLSHGHGQDRSEVTGRINWGRVVRRGRAVRRG